MGKNSREIQEAFRAATCCLFYLKIHATDDPDARVSGSLLTPDVGGLIEFARDCLDGTLAVAEHWRDFSILHEHPVSLAGVVKASYHEVLFTLANYALDESYRLVFGVDEGTTRISLDNDDTCTLFRCSLPPSDFEWAPSWARCDWSNDGFLSEYGFDGDTRPSEIWGAMPEEIWDDERMQQPVSQAAKAMTLRTDKLQVFGIRPPSLHDYHRLEAALKQERARLPAESDPDDADERDAWIYFECKNGTPFSDVIRKLKKRVESQDPKFSDWSLIDTPNGIKLAANRYGVRKGIGALLTRKGGRPNKPKT